MTTQDACVGPCNDAWRSTRRRHEDAVAAYQRTMAEWLTLPAEARGDRPQPPAEPDVHPTPGDPVWCARCVALVRRALGYLDDLAAMLAATADGHRTRPPEGRVSGTPAPSSPSPAVDTLDELYAGLAAVEDYWRAVRGYPTRPYRGRGAHARTATIAWLMDQLGGILAQPDSAAFGRDVLAWRARLQALTSSAPVQRRRGARCPRCDQRALVLRDDGYTECRRCGRLLSDDEYDSLVDQARGGAA